jgi:dephospho-CoA kinase
MKNLPDVIGIVGPIRAGKTTTASYLVQRYGYSLATNSDVLRSILDGMEITPSRKNLSMLGNSIFEVFGNDVIAKYRLERIGLGRIVVDGIRYIEELEYYSKNSNFKLIGIQANADVRFMRTVQGSEKFKDLKISRDEFDLLSFSRSELNVPELLSMADVKISNAGDIVKLQHDVDSILNAWSC